MKASILSSLASRALKFASDKDIGARALLEAKQNKLYISTCNGNDGVIVWADYIGEPFECAVHAEAFATMIGGFKSDDQITFTLKSDTLFVKGKSSFKIPTYEATAVYNMPRPREVDWIEVPINSDISTVLDRAIAMPIKHLKNFANTPLGVIVDEENVCYLSRSLSFIERNNSAIRAHIFASTLAKKPDKILKFFNNGSQLYLHGEDEICMLSLCSAKPIMYQKILEEVQKYNTSVIKIDVEVLRDLAKRTKSLKKAEEILQPSEVSFIGMEVTHANLTVRTKLSEESFPIINESDFNSIVKFNVVTDFLAAITHEAFVQESKTVELHIGKDMRLCYAVCGTARIVGALWAS